MFQHNEIRDEAYPKSLQTWLIHSLARPFLISHRILRVGLGGEALDISEQDIYKTSCSSLCDKPVHNAQQLKRHLFRDHVMMTSNLGRYNFT